MQAYWENECFDMFCESLKGHPKESTYKDIITNVKTKLSDNYVKYCLEEDSIENFLVHGDLWSNNIMYETGNKNCKLVDWQFLGTGNILADFGLFALASMDPKSTENNLVRSILFLQKNV